MRETSFLFDILMCIKDINTKKIEMLFKNICNVSNQTHNL